MRRNCAVTYFGKIPARGDFIKSSAGSQLAGTLDQWIAQTLELMATDARWKLIYDSAPPVQFAFLGSRGRLAIAGYMVPSSDSSGRRFPFVAACPFDVDSPMEFLARSPLALSRVWGRLEVLTRGLLDTDDAAEPLRRIAEAAIPVETAAAAYDAYFQDFLEMNDLRSLTALLAAGGYRVNLQHLFLALGLLLQPVMASGASHIDKGLVLPLPAEPLYRGLVASLWLDLISRFLGRADFELALFQVQRGDGRWSLVIGFSGAQARTLYGVFDAQVGAERNIEIEDADWVDAHLSSDYSLTKMARYLEQSDLSLAPAVRIFAETFLG